jgi:hypothetical protein
MMHHMMSLSEYESMVPHGVHHDTHHETHYDSIYESHVGGHHDSHHDVEYLAITPVAGYWELLDEMHLNPEFPFEMYIPLYYDGFKENYGWDYAELLQQAIYEGHSHMEAHEIYWPHHDSNEMEENFSMSSLTSMASKGA